MTKVTCLATRSRVHSLLITATQRSILEVLALGA